MHPHMVLGPSSSREHHPTSLGDLSPVLRVHSLRLRKTMLKLKRKLWHLPGVQAALRPTFWVCRYSSSRRTTSLWYPSSALSVFMICQSEYYAFGYVLPGSTFRSSMSLAAICRAQMPCLVHQQLKLPLMTWISMMMLNCSRYQQSWQPLTLPFSLSMSQLANAVCQELVQIIAAGRPKSLQDTLMQLRDFWSVRAELVINQGLIMRGPLLLIPVAMQPDILGQLHDDHQGVTRTTQLTSSCVWFPGIAASIKSLIQDCGHCKQFRRPLTEAMVSFGTLPLAHRWC